MIAIDQDPAGVQGWQLVPARSSGNGEVVEKPLSDGSYAIALLNRGSPALQIVDHGRSALQMPAAHELQRAQPLDRNPLDARPARSRRRPAYATVLLRMSAGLTAQPSGTR